MYVNECKKSNFLSWVISVGVGRSIGHVCVCELREQKIESHKLDIFWFK